ncbi:GerAB/ArcD/ProY family transporter [Paenibacillus sp. IB182496]|uniref:GerAB/ArcD/ProY family transporter n=1 Tax=Paenibacillus sabuli TaxID=2772509 RepID=A0A927GSW2_9BACL|nr:GerAB/ArcD/ProY family transporter [Paenibacillus sabuli]MBD2846706.1 GerAB/ArcD/ProY family transporter [Paenibacillus sabuli]
MNETITRFQFFSILLLSGLGMLPVALTGWLGHLEGDAWVPVAASAAAGVLGLLVAHGASVATGSLTLAEWAVARLGKLFGGCYVLLLAAALYLWGCITFLEHWYMMAYMQFSNTPFWLPGLFVLLVIGYMLSNGVASWARVFQLLLVPVMTVLFVLLAAQLWRADFGRLLPLGAGISRVGAADYAVSAFLLHGYVGYYFFRARTAPREGLFGAGLLAMSLSLIVLLLLVLLPIAVFDGRTSALFAYPFLESLRTVNVTALPLERVGFLLPLLLLVTSLCAMAVALHATMTSVCALFTRLNRRWTLIALLALFVPLLILEPSRSALRIATLWWLPAPLLLVLAVPLAMWPFAARSRGAAR